MRRIHWAGMQPGMVRKHGFGENVVAHGGGGMQHPCEWLESGVGEPVIRAAGDIGF